MIPAHRTHKSVDIDTEKQGIAIGTPIQNTVGSNPAFSNILNLTRQTVLFFFHPPDDLLISPPDTLGILAHRSRAILTEKRVATIRTDIQNKISHKLHLSFFLAFGLIKN